MSRWSRLVVRRVREVTKRMELLRNLVYARQEDRYGSSGGSRRIGRASWSVRHDLEHGLIGANEPQCYNLVRKNDAHRQIAAAQRHTGS